ncbi:MAG: CCA tRNA nucleotidyltransferase [Ruminiclostridium sp.]|nr:CCA tRNA nucleotidyltransferase [Ruminiclostridium sp.]
MYIPGEAEEIITTLEANGHEAYLVGGCVRDALMGRTPKDYDICTSALPQQVILLFDKTIPTGVNHGTVTVMLRNLPFEVTTFRTDADYTDHRHPDTVLFSGSLLQDLERRDFTINAMAFHPVKGIIDPFDGLDDLRKKLIRTVGEPLKRFREDALRMLRAVRFKARFGFSVHKVVLDAIKELAGTIRFVSRERILSEINGILLSPFPEEMSVIFQTGLSEYIFPACEAGIPSLYTLKLLPEKLQVRWAALLREVGITGKEVIKTFCEGMKMSNTLSKDILTLSGLLAETLPYTGYSVRKAVCEVGISLFNDALTIYETTCVSGIDFNAVRQLLDDITLRQQCIHLADLAVNGTELIGEGYLAGKELGDLLDALFICVLQKPELNRKDILMEFARQMVTKTT